MKTNTILKASPLKRIMVEPLINVRNNGQQEETKKVFKGWETILTALDGQEVPFYLHKQKQKAADALSNLLDSIRNNKVSLTSYNAILTEK